LQAGSSDARGLARARRARRGQAELLSTVIIVSIAVTLALGLVYYLAPVLAQARAQQQLMTRLAEISSGLTLTLAAYENTSTGFNAVVSVVNSGAGLVNLYLGVIAVDDGGVPQNISTLSYDVYNMTASVASIDGVVGWTLLPALTVDVRDVYVYVKDDYYSLYSFWGGGNYTLYSLGVFRSGDTGVFKVEAEGLQPGYTYVIALFTMANNRYYLVGELAVPFG